MSYVAPVSAVLLMMCTAALIKTPEATLRDRLHNPTSTHFDVIAVWRHHRQALHSLARRATSLSGFQPFGMLNRPFVHKRVHALLQLCLFFRRLRLGRPRWPQRSVEIQPEKKVAQSVNDC